KKFHDDVSVAFVLTDVVNGANVGMVQRRRGLCLAAKSSQRLWIPRYVLGQELQRNKAMQPRVFGLIHNPHSATAKFLHNAVMGNGLPDHDAPPCKAEHLSKSMRANEFATFEEKIVDESRFTHPGSKKDGDRTS